MRTLAIGDIHGCLAALDAVLAEVDLQPDDLLVTLGDYVDRGPDSRGVIERLIGLQSKCKLVTLQGNHELMMLRARYGSDDFKEWVRSGGREALASYKADPDVKMFSKSIPFEHWDFLRSCVSYHETESFFFVHANAQYDMPIAEQSEQMLFWEHLESGRWRVHISGKTMICGHTQQRSGRPLVLDRAVCIDTWAYGDGWLTCLDVENEIYWQANQQGQTRVGNLMFRTRR